jgi:hypothetical protein
MRAGCALAMAAVLCGAGPAGAEVTITDVCAAEGGGPATERDCVADWLRSAELFVMYGRMNGHLDAEGDYNFGKQVERLWNWRTLLGIVPREVYSDCAAAEAGAGDAAFIDFRKVWDCIKAGDPEAAKLEAI